LHSTDKLLIDTPEQIALELPLAGIGSRSLALAVDSLLQLGAFILIFLLLALSKFTGAGFVSGMGAIVVALVPFLIQWGYFTFFEIFWNGQTPGKRTAQIRVIKESGRPITVVEAIARNLVRTIDMLPGIYAVGLICMLLNKRNKRLGDYVAGTVVVHEKTIEKVSTIWNAPNAPATADHQAIRISSEELVLIETYLNRRSAFDSVVRKKTAAQIVSLIQKRTGIEPAEGQSADTFLETVARKARETARYR
jgi:uncharacterized RDD family membrane protein YckC